MNTLSTESNTAVIIRQEISSVRFGFYTDGDVISRSVVQIVSPIAFDALGNYLKGGLYDPRMGPVSSDESCRTCGNPYMYCPGHTGHIQLTMPVYHIFTFPLLLNMLKAKCFYCHSFRVPQHSTKALAAKLHLIDTGYAEEAFALDDQIALALQQQLKQSSSSSSSSPSTLDELINQCLSRQRLHSSISSSSAQDRTYRRLLIKQFFSQNFVQKKCDTCHAFNPKIRHDSYNKIFMAPLPDKLHKINFAERLCLKSALQSPSLQTNHHLNDNYDTTTNDFEKDTHDAGWDSDDSITADRTNPTLTTSPSTPSSSADKFMHALEVEAQMKLTWKKHPLLCSKLFGSALSMEDDTSTKNLNHSSTRTTNSSVLHNEAYKIFFMRAISVPPSRFRPPMSVGTIVAEHAQNHYLSKMLELNSKILLQLSTIREETALSADVDDGAILSNDNNISQKAQEVLYQTWIDLQTTVNCYIDSSKDPEINIGSTNIGIKQILEKKEGLFRKHMMGKRVDFACRSVISPDPYVGTNEIGIPIVFAKKLTYPVPVSSLNVEEMRTLVVRGPDNYPGAVWVEEGGCQRYDLSKMSALRREALAARLISEECQMRVGRQLRTGDMMLMNRQPSLHKPSIMAHRVRILHNPEQKTVRMHYANCNTYNADFDGDEMNGHFPQNDIAQAEASCIMATDLQYIVPTDGSPLRGLIQDHVDGGVKLCNKDTFLEKWEYIQLIFAALASLPGLELIRSDMEIQLMPPAIKKPRELWTGKQVVTSLLYHLRLVNDRDNSDDILPGVSMEGKAKTPSSAFGEDTEEHLVIIRDGELVRGVLDKAAFGASKFGLVHCVYEAYGPEKAGLLLNAFGRLFTAFIQYYSGHSCRMEDLILTKEADASRHELIQKSYSLGSRAAKAWADSDGGKVDIAKYSEEPNSDLPLKAVEVATTSAKIKELLSGKDGPANAASLDSFMQSQLNPLASQIIKTCLPNGLAVPFPANTFSLMVNTGAKGSTVNQSQVSCALGQQALEGRRVPRMSSGRTLPSFAPFDPNPRADGFIADRFLTGLRPQEYYAHCMSGREGLVDTAVKTSRSGYLQRCLVKHLEELKVSYDATVRDSEGGVVQFLYGEDGIDPIKAAHLDCTSSTLRFLARNRNALLKRYPALPNSSIDQAAEDSRWAQRNRSDTALFSLEKGMYVKARRLRIGSEWKRGALCRGWFDAVVTKCHPDKCLFDIRYAVDGVKVKKVPAEVTFPNSGGKLSRAIGGKCILIKPGVPDPVISDYNRFKGKNRVGQSGNCVSEKVASSTTGSIEKDYELQQTMKNANITPKDLGTLVASKYSSSLCAPGEAVGCIAAQSIGEPSTQMTLNTFHLAGAGANLTLGIPRLREIIMTATRDLKTPYMSVPILPWVSERGAKHLMRSFMKITLNELISCHGGISVTESLAQNASGSWERAYQVNLKLYPSERIKEAFGLKTEDVARVVTKTFIPKLSALMRNELKRANVDGGVQQVSVAGGATSDFIDEGGGNANASSERKKKVSEREEYEDEEAGDEDGVTGSRFGHRKEMVSYGDMDDEENEIAKQAGQEDDFGDQSYENEESNGEAPTVTDDDEEQDSYGSSNALKIHKKSNTLILDPLRVDPSSRSLLMIGLVEKAASSTIVRACKGIDQAFLCDEEDGRGRCLRTVGMNFAEIWKLTNVVDHHLLVSNDIWAIRCAYGVEAARMSIVSQISGVFAVYGISVDPRHLSLIGDYMTYDGGYKAMNRTGMMANSSPFLQMSFETTAAFMVEAAVSGLKESLVSPSANIVVGHPVRHGTGAFDCLVKAV